MILSGSTASVSVGRRSNVSCDGREGRETSGGMDVVPGVTVMEEGGRSSRRVEMDEEQDKEEEEGAGGWGGVMGI